eukprot:11184955-Prorocentrum_lima.AAC.1
MTSSLVGSEMCIRDSSRSAHAEACPPLPELSYSSAAAQAPHRPPPVIPPVSYTHLTLPTICSV